VIVAAQQWVQLLMAFRTIPARFPDRKQQLFGESRKEAVRPDPVGVCLLDEKWFRFFEVYRAILNPDAMAKRP